MIQRFAAVGQPSAEGVGASIGIVIPVLNEAGTIGRRLAGLQNLRERGCELVVVDGGSSDATIDELAGLTDSVLSSAPGRAVQMNKGACASNAKIIWFLHADCEPPEHAETLIREALADPHRQWGRFDVQLSGRQLLLRVVAKLMNLRSRWTGIATGDQGIFVRRKLFDAVGGYPEIALMEDVALSRALKRYAKPVCLRQSMTVSSRRWEQAGIFRTIMLMWRLRLMYFFGVPPKRLAQRYYDRG